MISSPKQGQILSDNKLLLEGVAAPNRMVHVCVDGNCLYLQADASGRWQKHIDHTLSTGNHTVTATWVDDRRKTKVDYVVVVVPAPAQLPPPERRTAAPTSTPAQEPSPAKKAAPTLGPVRTPSTRRPMPTASPTVPESAPTSPAPGPRTGVSIIYDANGANVGRPPVDYGAYHAGQNVMILGNPGRLMRNGYTFMGWSLHRNGSGPLMRGGHAFRMPESDVTLYAVWARGPMRQQPAQEG